MGRAAPSKLRRHSEGGLVKRITRRDLLRYLGGLSVMALGGVATREVTRGFTSSPSADRAIGSASANSRDPWLRARSTSSPSSSFADTVAHAPHHQATSEVSQTTLTQSSIGTTSSPGGGVEAATTTQITSEASNVSATSSTTPLVSAGTIELVGVLAATTVPRGAVAKVVGNIELRGDLVIEGLLTGIDTFAIEGNGFQIAVSNGGQIDLRGRSKTGWVRGASPTGWEGGDRVLSAPAGAGQYDSFSSGMLESVRLSDGRSIAPEQFNLSRTIVINNVSRLMFHHGAGRQTLKYLAVTNSGISDQLGFYPIHFHLNGDSTRGSLVEGVVVENGQNHAFVPHASHGITFLDCIAFDTSGDAYWWDPPPPDGGDLNDTHDTLWQHCLAASVHSPSTDHRLSAFFLGRGSGNRCIDCTAVAVRGGKNSSGFHWPEKAGGLWEFRDCVAHNNAATGIFTWQNNPDAHVIQNFIAYRCGRAGIEHGAYRNNYRYLNVSVTETTRAVIAHALPKDDGSLLFENLVSDSDLVIAKHNQPSSSPVVYRRCNFPRVVLQEATDGGGEPGIHQFEDSGLDPGRFDVANIHPRSVLRIMEAGRPVWQWSQGSWAVPNG